MKNLTTEINSDENSWRGYTLSELRYRRAYVQVKLEMAREALFSRSKSVMNNGVIPMKGVTGGIMGKVMGALDYFDYAFLAYKAGSKIIHIFKALRPKKNR